MVYNACCLHESLQSRSLAIRFYELTTVTSVDLRNFLPVALGTSTLIYPLAVSIETNVVRRPHASVRELGCAAQAAARG
jgi:hypothetical protein